MKFTGDIIITDPCYIIKSPEDYAKELGIPFPAYPKYTEDIKAYDKAMSEYRSFTNKYDDWRKCEYGEDMEQLGITKCICESTIYGDWSCTTWSTPRKDVAAQLEELCELQRKQYELRKQYGEDSVQSKIYDDKMFSATVDLKNIGGFCADAGMVAVFLLDEVLKYNPNFDYHINRLWTTTLIKDFDGEVEYYIDDAEGEAHIIGTGNVNFFTTQTGF
jgi:hypothetical protein|nr:MAG: hypothetical protein [Bacteriophage sp.]DAW05363.1 MAG TPA: hypothetical protein [Caudoviricetes sp.]